MSERDIFITALEIADPAERAAYLERACAGDADLLSRVRVLLDSAGRAGDFLDRPAPEQLAAVCPGPIREELLHEMRRRGLLGVEEEPAPLVRYPPLRQVDLARFRHLIQSEPYAALLQGNGRPARNEVRAAMGI